MKSVLAETLDHLAALVAFDTQNPPRAIDKGGIFSYLRSKLPGFKCALTDSGDGRVALLATRGRTDTVFNFHIDTVPAAGRWERDPFSLSIEEDRAYGLGACDIKGAAAAMLAAAAATEDELALLFTSDEEAGGGRCVLDFLGTQHGFSHAIVAEPTGCKAVLAHRGIATATIRFAGVAGHASGRDRVQSSAIHRAVRWAQRCLDYADSHQDDSFGSLVGFPFNIGRIEGGVKPNIVASSAVCRFGVRPLPARDGRKMLETLRDLADPGTVDSFSFDFIGSSLPRGEGANVDRSASLARRLGLPVGPEVDFWTEAALFAEAGLTAFVYGPGSIEQAHTADEWVALTDLETVGESYARLIRQQERANA